MNDFTLRISLIDTTKLQVLISRPSSMTLVAIRTLMLFVLNFSIVSLSSFTVSFTYEKVGRKSSML